MYCIISPAKKIAKVPTILSGATEPMMLDQTQILVDQMKAYSVNELQQLMGISTALAELNRFRFTAYTRDHIHQSSAGQAIFQFEGDVYRYFDVDSLKEHQIKNLNDNLGILSGLYGLLRPLDLMQPYRLEMGTPLETTYGKGLYRFWGNRVTEKVQSMVGHDHVVLNLASEEYAKVIDWNMLNHWTVQFKENRGGQLKTIGVNAKRARGCMARWVVDHKPKCIDDLSTAKPYDYQLQSIDAKHRVILFVKG